MLESLGARDSFGVTELERFADCSSAWFVERFLDPKSIDAEVDPKLRGSVAHTALNRFFSGLPKELGSDRVEAERLEDAVRFMRACLDDALAGVRMDMTDMQRRELDQTLWRDLEALVRAEAEEPLPLVPRRFEVSFGSERSPQELQRGIDLGGVTLSGKIDRIDVDPYSARGIVIDYKSGKGAHSAAEIEKELRLQIPLYMLVLRDLVGLEPLGGLYRPLSGARKMRGLVREEAREDGLPGLAENDYVDDETFWSASRRRGRRHASSPCASRRATCGTTPRATSARPGATSGLSAGSGAHELGQPNPEQRAAVEAHGEVFVSAGAGTGKTAVLVERFARAVCDDGLDVDSILVITYTRKAAGELRSRIREALLARGRPDAARELDGAWISTIHGFCNRLLRAHPFAAGLDPRFRELDEAQAQVLRSEAFDEALASFCAGDEPERLRLLVAYGGARLRRMLIGIYETLRAAGRPLVLELGEAAPLDDRLDDLREAARCLATDAAATTLARDDSAALLALIDSGPLPDRLLDLSAFRARGERAASYEEARKRVEQAALDSIAAGDRELLQELLNRFHEAYSGAKERESALDFEDLQLAARDLLRDHPEIREREQLRFRALMVDEFQDTNRLQCELIDLLAEGTGEREVFYVGDEFQSIYGFRHADVAVFRERRERAGGGLALTRNYRSRPEVLAAVNFLFGEEFGDEFQPLAASGDFPDPVFGHPVELLVTDKASYADTGEHWRRGEARNIARRVRELVDTGAAEPGEIVLLFAAGTDAEWYEEELRRLGLPTYRGTGRRYFGQQQVVDLLAYLRLLQNRYDDQALLTVLASPLVGVSNDALVLIRRAAPKRPLFTAVELKFPPGAGGRGRAAPARVPAALRPASGRVHAALARAPLREDRRRARLRPGRPRPVGRQAPLRQPAQAGAARAVVRGAARPRHRGLRPVRPPSRRRSAPASSRPSPRKRERARSGC